MYHVSNLCCVSSGITLIRIILWLFTYFLCTVLSVLIIDLSWGFRLAIISFIVLLGEHKSSWLWSEMWQGGGLPPPWMWLVNVFANGFYSVKLFPVCECLLQLHEDGIVECEIRNYWLRLWERHIWRHERAEPNSVKD